MIVVPAQAGTLGSVMQTFGAKRPTIPACAGMTRKKGAASDMETTPFFKQRQNFARTVRPYMRGSSTKPIRERVPAPPRSGVFAVIPRVISLLRLVPHNSKVNRSSGVVSPIRAFILKYESW
jgi:hypothetical protein